MKLREILHTLNQMDDDMPPEEFDPAALVGTLNDKVDAIKWRIDSWYATAEMIQREWLDPMQKKMASLVGKAEKLEKYVLEQMVMNNFEKLPGKMFDLAVRLNPPAVKIDLEASPELYLQYDTLINQKTTYAWDKKKVKEALETGKDLGFACITRSKKITFTTKKED